MTELLKPILEKHGLTLETVKSPDKRAKTVICRQECAQKLRSIGLSLPRIGLILNRRHCSIVHLLYHRKPERKPYTKKVERWETIIGLA